MAKPGNEKPKQSAKDFIDSLVIAFVIAMAIRALLFSSYKIPSESMLNTLLVGDFLIGSRISYYIGDPKSGDVAIFRYPLEPHMYYIKRVIGMPGDKIEMRNKVVYKNGQEFEEFYKVVSSGWKYGMDNIPEFVVPEGHYLMLGDNRDNSSDGRVWGLVPREAFVAKAKIIYFSLNTEKGSRGIRWSRILSFVK